MARIVFRKCLIQYIQKGHDDIDESKENNSRGIGGGTDHSDDLHNNYKEFCMEACQRWQFSGECTGE